MSTMPDGDALDAFDATLADAIVAGIERGGPAAVAEFLSALAEANGRPPGYLYGIDCPATGA
jgi:hypothetical protein